MGTDRLGRDTFSRIIYGSRPAIIVSMVAVNLAAIIGMALGLIAGFYGRIVNVVIMRAMDTIMTVPPILLAVTIAALLGGGLLNVVIALGIGLMPQLCPDDVQPGPAR